MRLGKYTIIEQEKLDNLQIHVNHVNQQLEFAIRDNAQLVRENVSLKESLDKLLGNPAEVKIYHPDKQHPHFRLQLDFDPTYIMDALVHGHMDGLIDYSAEKIKHEIIRELKTLNFVRYDE